MKQHQLSHNEVVKLLTLPRTKNEEEKDIARRGDHIVSLYCGSDSKHDRSEEHRCFVANIRVLSLVHILNVLFLLPFVVG